MWWWWIRENSVTGCLSVWNRLVSGFLVIRERSGFGLVDNQREVSYWLCGDQREVRVCLGGDHRDFGFDLVVNQREVSYWLCGDQREVRLWLGGEWERGQSLGICWVWKNSVIGLLEVSEKVQCVPGGWIREVSVSGLTVNKTELCYCPIICKV